MTAIDVLLAKAGELPGMSGFYAALVELAALQESMEDALSPFYSILAGLPDWEPFRYDFVIPAEAPEIKAEPGEGPRDTGRTEVAPGPISVYAIVKEIQKAVEGVGRDSPDIQAIYANYAAPAALPAARPEAIERTPAMAPAHPGREMQDTGNLPVETSKHDHAVSSEEWVEKSIRRSTVIMSEMNEVRQNIVDRTVIAGGDHHISPDASSIGAGAGYEPRQPPENAAPPVEQRLVSPQQVPGGARTVSSPGNVTEIPPIRPRAGAVPPAEEAVHNARNLSGALMRSAESIRPSAFPEAGVDKHEMPRQAGQAHAPALQEMRSTPAQASPPVTRTASVMRTSSPVLRVVDSIGAMGEYMRAVAAVGAEAGIAYSNTVVSPAGEALFTAMAGVLPEPSSAGSVPHAALPEASYRPHARAVMGLSANIAPVLTGRSPGISLIHRLIRSAPVMAGEATSQAREASSSRDILSWMPEASPLAGSGAENIVNITVPQAARGVPGGSAAANKVVNFHNTFNITVNATGGEERDLKELGKKIGQILSEEIKRYGGLP